MRKQTTARGLKEYVIQGSSLQKTYFGRERSKEEKRSTFWETCSERDTE